MNIARIVSGKGAVRLPGAGTFGMTVMILGLGFFLIYPAVLLLINAFNVAPEMFVPPRVWGFDNWRLAYQQPGLLVSLGNSFLIWALTMVVSFPVAVLVSWTLARTRMPFSHGLEFMFWISYMMPGLATTIAWIALLDQNAGFVNVALRKLPFIDQGLFNIYSIQGIVWAHAMANGISLKVMLLTPAFRNMNAALEEAARVSGASGVRTMLRVTLPMMVAPMALVLALQLLRIFQSFEIELLLGRPIEFFVYSTKIYEMVRKVPPLYGQATALASATLFIIVLIIPLQRWILQRRAYTTIAGNFRVGLIDLGPWKWLAFGAIAFLLLLLTVAPVASLVLGSFMTRMGVFFLEPAFTLDHWKLVMTDPSIRRALRTTFIIATATSIASPLLFSVIAYTLVRTRLRGRVVLDFIIWGSGAIPGMLAGLGLLSLFLGTPGLGIIYGTIYALILVVVLQGNTLGVNMLKGVFVQVGQDMEEAARISGAGWTRTYFRIWVPLLMPSLILVATINFVLAAGTTSSIILLASRSTTTLSLLALDYASSEAGRREAAGILSLIIMALTVGVAVLVRAVGLRLGLRHDVRASDQATVPAQAVPGGRQV